MDRKAISTHLILVTSLSYVSLKWQILLDIDLDKALCKFKDSFIWFLAASIASMVERIPGTSLSVCQLCGYSSQWQSNVTKHVIAKHSNIRFPCQFCDKICTQEGSRVYHYKKIHGLDLTAAQIRTMIEKKRQESF